jgi:hypothetical protein
VTASDAISRWRRFALSRRGAEVSGDGGRSSGDRDIGPERAERLDDADKGLLEQVLGDMALADEPEDAVDEGLLDPLDELPGRRRGVPAGTPKEDLPSRFIDPSDPATEPPSNDPRARLVP